MAESSQKLLQSDFASLKGTLCTQQQLLQKLYNELDVERESSAVAASEALSMILRLQGEKAAVMLEAEQYKRLAEEKMCHAEESMSIFEDLIYQKEMEIASLYYQVQAYRYKLLSMGCADPGDGEIKFSENFLQRTETLAGEVIHHNIVRRNSAPPIPLKHSYPRKGGCTEREGSSSSEKDMVEKIMEEQRFKVIRNDVRMDIEKKPTYSMIGDTTSYCKQVRKLDIQVKEITDANCAIFRSESRSPLPLSQIGSGLFLDSSKEALMKEDNQVKHPEYLLEKKISEECGRSSSVYDVFEVPQSLDNKKCGVPKIKEHDTSILQGKKIFENLDIITHEAVKSFAKYQREALEELLPSECHENNLCKPREGASVESNAAIVLPTHGVTKSQVETLPHNRSSEIVELERQSARVETDNRNEEELKLLNEIREQLNSIQSEIRSLKTKKSHKKNDEYAFICLQEAMLHFWI